MNKFGIIVKNNLKLIFRNKVLMAIVFICVFLVIAALSNAFHTLLDSADELRDFTIGYTMDEANVLSIMEDTMVQMFEEEGVSVQKYDDADPTQIIKDGKAEVFIVFDADKYHIFGDDKKQIQARTVQYVLFNAESMLNATLASATGQIKTASFTAEALPTIETSQAENYYGLIEIIYFACLGSVFLALLYQTERKNNIAPRFRVGNVNAATLYFGKLTAGVLFAWVIQIFLETACVTAVFDVKLGNPLLSLALMCLGVVAFESFGMIFILLFKNMAASIGLLFMIMWIWGFIGGTFETYMYSQVPENIKRLSPVYYLNRSIVEISVQGKSDYVMPCVYCLLAMTAISVGLGILITAKKKEV